MLANIFLTFYKQSDNIVLTKERVREKWREICASIYGTQAALPGVAAQRQSPGGHAWRNFFALMPRGWGESETEDTSNGAARPVPSPREVACPTSPGPQGQPRGAAQAMTTQ